MKSLPKLIRINDDNAKFAAAFNLYSNEIVINKFFADKWKKEGITEHELIRHELVHWKQKKIGLVYADAHPIQIFFNEMQANILMFKRRSWWFILKRIPEMIDLSLTSVKYTIMVNTKFNLK
jgi:hypothetical protein